MPKVSVIIPCYNHARYLGHAVGSCMRQTWRDFEIIIVNDGSTDDTRAVAESLAARHPGVVRVINQPNSGLPSARNNGIAKAAGEYILPLDADDMISPRFLEKTMNALEADPGASLAYTWTRMFGKVRKVSRNGEFNRTSLLTRSGPSCSMVFAKAAWKKVGGYNPVMDRGGEDWEFACSLFEAGYRGVVVAEPLFLYRRHGFSMIDDMVANHSQTGSFRIKMLHPRLFEPGLSSISLRLARAVIWLKYYSRDRLSHFIYVRFPGLHKKLARLKYGMKYND